ncbi:hypothetical protein SKAU_G00389420 [Synaphobranchus kaupii]|uniref:Uncharacterized protein n=1 Tax=Synaphobranchus kaupii TaxID=118154 RepID=A0A9Q1EBB0_SYNKA|nr:hypothetical protein SKAU_G00389420 [Synaphobranchus kaupii]
MNPPPPLPYWHPEAVASANHRHGSAPQRCPLGLGNAWHYHRALRREKTPRYLCCGLCPETRGKERGSWNNGTSRGDLSGGLAGDHKEVWLGWGGVGAFLTNRTGGRLCVAAAGVFYVGKSEAASGTVSPVSALAFSHGRHVRST